MYFSFSKKIFGVRMGMLFRPDELQKIGKREQALRNFLERIAEENEKITSKSLAKLGLNKELLEALDSFDNFPDTNEFLSESNLKIMDEVAKLKDEINSEFEKMKVVGTLSSQKREKITDLTFKIKDLIDSMKYEDIKPKIYEVIPKSKIDAKIRKLHAQKTWNSIPWKKIKTFLVYAFAILFWYFIIKAALAEG